MSPAVPLDVARPAPARRLRGLLGDERVLREQVMGVLMSLSTYVVYSGILLVQVAAGLVSAGAAAALLVAIGVFNLATFAWVRLGRARSGPDPGLARTQLVVGIVFMYAGYALQGPSAPGTTIVMASHVVYAMFTMTPQAVWRLVAASLLGLAATLMLCQALWPQRYPAEVQLVTFLYAALVVPLIALLAGRVAAMTTKLRRQQAQLQQAMADLRAVAQRDALTLAHNRHHMGELMAAQAAAHQRSGRPWSLALIDIDHFKHINDEHGHAAGDEVLRRFAALAHAELRTVDLVSRWGGEEFLVALPQAGAADAARVVQRLHQTLGETGAGMPHGLCVSFSAGVTEVQPGEPLEDAIARADQAMYQAKRAGRARVVTA